MTILFLLLLLTFLPFLADEVGDWGSDSSESDSYDLESSIVTQLDYYRLFYCLKLGRN